MSSAADLFALAFRSHQAGDLARAEQLYRQALQVSPAHADAWCFLGAACQGQGKLAEAEAHYRRAAELAPDHPSAATCLGGLLAGGGRTLEAAAWFQHALRSQPSSAGAHFNLAVVLGRLGQPDAATAHYRQALRLQPDHADAAVNLGVLLSRAGQWDDSAACLRDALRSRPERADAHCYLGNALTERGQADEAVAAFEAALRLRPDYPLAYYGLGQARKKQGRTDEAVTALREALRLRPDFAEAQVSLANAMVDLCRLGEAEDLFRQALRRRPDFVEAQTRFGAMLAMRGDNDEALACLDEALRRAPDHADAHLSRAMIWLARGDWARGWPEYEWRLRARSSPRRTFPRPRWDGSPLEGRTLLLVWEQGLGDTLMFLRYAPLLRGRGGRVLVECQPPLQRLLADALGPGDVVARGATFPEHDVYAPLPSLPGILGTTPTNVPAPVPYLRADEGLVRRWRQELGAGPAFRVGISWQGSTGGNERAVPLTFFEPLSRVPGAQLVSLQKGPGVEQLKEVAEAWPVLDLGPGLDEASGAFRDTAAVMKSLDLVVAADSAVAHLAGALGVPVWLALPFVADWRWLLGRDDSPWYPTMRLYRQRQPGDWEEVFARIADEVRKLAAGARRR